MAPDSHQEQEDELDHGITLLVNVKIDVDHTVYDLTEARAILSKARRIAVGNCPCRRAPQLRRPLDVCLSLEKQADAGIEGAEATRSPSKKPSPHSNAATKQDSYT